MKKFAVYYKAYGLNVETYIHVFARDADDAKSFVNLDGVGFEGSKVVYPDEITHVEEVKPLLRS